MQRNFIFSALIDCALANLIAIGKIVSADIFVFSRAIEDAVDMALTRSRAEAELGRMMTEIEKLENLRDIWRNSKDRNLLKCNVAKPSSPRRNVVLRNLAYSRGTVRYPYFTLFLIEFATYVAHDVSFASCSLGTCTS